MAENSEYFIVRTVPGKEFKLIDTAKKILAKKEGHGVYAFFTPEAVKGYIFAECTDVSTIINNLRGIPNFKGVIQTPVSFDELAKYFEKEGEVVEVNERDIVEVIAGPFKGDKARIVRIVPGKDEIVIEQIDTPVPIPVTLSRDDIRVIKDEETQE